MNFIVEKIQMNEFDFLAFFIDLIYMIAAVVVSVKFSEYFANFKFNQLIKNDKEDFGILLIFSYVFFIILISATVLHHALHESFFNCVLSIVSYTLLVIAVMLSRKPIALINISPDFIAAQNLSGNKSSQAYDSSSFVCSAITISGILYYFYELSLASIFLLCVAAECVLEVTARIVLLISAENLRNVINKDNLRLINAANIMKLHISLLLVASACLIDINEDNGMLILATWIFAMLALLIISLGFNALLDQLLFRRIQYDIGNNADNVAISSKLMLFLALDLAIIILLN